MAVTPVFLTGFEYDVLGTTANGPFSEVNVGGTNSVDIATTPVRSGTYALHVNHSDSATSCYVRWDVAGGSTDKGVMRFAFRLASLPGADAAVMTLRDAIPDTAELGYQFATGKLYMKIGGGTAQVGPVASSGQWYMVDLRFDPTGTTKTVDWQIDGVAYTQASRSGRTASTIAQLRLGTGAGVGTYEGYFDDLMVSLTSGDYPIGDYKIYSLVPTSDGTHNNSGSFQDQSAASLSGSTTVYTLIDEIPPTTSDFAQQAGGGASDYLEVNFADTTENAILGVKGFVAYRSSGSGGNIGATKVRRNDGTDVDIFPSGDMSAGGTTQRFKQALVTAPGGGWTKAELNALKGRIGYSSDVAPLPRWDAFSLEYAAAVDQTATLTGLTSGETFGATEVTTFTFRGQSSDSAVVPASSTTLSVPGGVVQDDLLLVFVSVQASITVPTPGGWTLIRGDATGTLTNAGVRLYSFRRPATGSEPPSYTFNFSAATSAGHAALMLAYGGGDSPPIDQSAAQADDLSTSVTVVAPTVTTTVDNGILLTAYSINPLIGSASAETLSIPAGMAELYDSDLTGDGVNILRATLAVDKLQLGAQGATGDKTSTAGNNGRNIGQTLALMAKVPGLRTVTCTGLASAEAFGSALVSPGLLFRAASSQGVDNDTFVTLAKPTGVVTNDLMIAFLQVQAASSTGTIQETVTAFPSGWSLIRQDVTVTTTAAGCRMTAWYKIATSVEPSTYTWTFAGRSDIAAGIVAFYGVDTVIPINAHGGLTNDSGTSKIVTAPPIITTVDNCMLVTAHGLNPNTLVAGPFLQTPPPGMIELVDVSVPNASSPGTNRATLEINETILGPADTTTPKTSTLTIDNGRNVGQAVAIAPAAANPSQRVRVGPSRQGFGAMVGWWTDNPWSGLEAHEATLGKTFAVARIYSQWTTTDSRVASALAAQKLVISSHKPPSNGNGWVQVANGSQDARIDALATQYKNYGVEIIFTFHHEPHADATDLSGGTYGTSANYVTAFRRIVAHFRAAAATNVKFGYCASNLRGLTVPDKCYPGDDVVDLIINDAYNWYTYQSAPWVAFQDLWAPHVALAKLHNKPLLMAETGSHFGNGDGAPADRAQWFRDGATWMKTDPDASAYLIGFCYFHSPPPVVDWTFLNPTVPSGLTAAQMTAAKYPPGTTVGGPNPGYNVGTQGWIDAFVDDPYFRDTPFPVSLLGGIPTAETFGTMTAIGGDQLLIAGGIASEEAFGALRVDLNVVVVTGIPSAEAFGQAVAGLTLNLTGLPTKEAFGHITIVEPAWWNSKHPYRRRTLIAGQKTDLPVNHPVVVPIDLTTTRDHGKIRPDYQDVEILSYATNRFLRWRRQGRVVSAAGNILSVRFLLPEAISADQSVPYFIYYGNPSASGIDRQDFTDNPWPIHLDKASPSISYTRPREHWRDGVSSVRHAQASLEFVGVAVRIIADRALAAGIAEIQIDSGLWQAVDLYSATPHPAVEVFSKTGLTPGTHKLRYRVSGRKNPKATSLKVNLVALEYLKPVMVIDGGEEIDESIFAPSLTGTI